MFPSLDILAPIAFAVAISANLEVYTEHDDYDTTATDKKLDSLTGGPASCEAWGAAYGAGGPCESCAYRGKIKNPAVQLGTVPDVAPPGAVALLEPENVPEWVAELNLRFALVRHGSKMVIVDMQTPSMTGRGVVLSVGYLDVAAFRQLLNGRFAPGAYSSGATGARGEASMSGGLSEQSSRPGQQDDDHDQEDNRGRGLRVIHLRETLDDPQAEAGHNAA